MEKGSKDNSKKNALYEKGHGDKKELNMSNAKLGQFTLTGD